MRRSELKHGFIDLSPFKITTKKSRKETFSGRFWQIKKSYHWSSVLAAEQEEGSKVRADSDEGRVG